MRLFLPLFLLSFFACTGLPTGQTPAGVPAPPPSAPAKSTVSATDSGPIFGNQYLVILGSKRDPNEVIPGLAVLAAHSELGLQPSTLLSSRYKNLMPCYTVTFAAAYPDVKQAKELVKKLGALGVESYVKNSGAFVGPSAAIDSFCARKPGEGGLSFVLDRAGSAWVPVELPDGTFEALLASASRPQAISSDYSTWEQALPIQNAGNLSIGTGVSLVGLQAGESHTCKVQKFSMLTVGTPHFGYLQQNPNPSQPSCGEPQLYAQLDCPINGPALLSDRVTVLPLGAEVSAAWVEPLLKGNSDWEPLEEGWTRSYQLHSLGDLRLLRAKVGDEMGVCGGTEFSIAGIYTAEGQPVLPLRRLDFAEVVGVLDLGQDGKLELLVDAFPEGRQIMDGEGKILAVQETPYCDCPC